MAKENLAELSVEKLRKRKKFASLVLGILVGLIIVNVAVGVYTRDFFLAAAALALVAVGLPVFLGMRKIDAELARRDDA